MHKNHLKAAHLFARLMDSQFSFFGIKFGFDSILGITPGVGDTVSMLLSLYLIWIGVELKLPTKKIVEMLRNILIDTLIGAVPIIGDVSDIFIKSNNKNVRILEEFANSTQSNQGRP